MVDENVIAFPTPARAVSGPRIDQLIRWYEAQATSEERLAVGLDAEGLAEAAQRNRTRARAHRDTVLALSLLQQEPEVPVTEFRGHLTPKERPKAQVRAPP